jgi:type IV pilus assembly protein PilF
LLRKTIDITTIVLFCLAFTGCAGNQATTKNQATAFENLGMAFVREGNLRTGLAKLLEAVKLDPENPYLHHEVAMVYRNLGEYKLALPHFNKALALKPRFPEAQNNLGTLYLLLRDWDHAIDCFQKAVNDVLYKTPHIGYNNLGLAYYNKGEYQKAIDRYRHAIKLFSSYSRCYRNMGIAYEAVNKWDLAIDAYEKAIFFTPEYAAAHLSLGTLYLKLHQNKKAGEALRQTIKTDKKAGPYAEEAKRLLKTIER